MLILCFAHWLHLLPSQDYDTAKLLKEAETQLKSLGQQLAQLEVAKRQAVEEEDYDRAKMLKVRKDGGASDSQKYDIPLASLTYSLCQLNIPLRVGYGLNLF